ncbi:MAG: hypothetical protein HOC71_16485 [Candidatus Latescibacteria bacterium]|nr:hypothetical protein [Candidatus Latescibacterota bacterium]
MSSNSGLLVYRDLDHALGLFDSVSASFIDKRIGRISKIKYFFVFQACALQNVTISLQKILVKDIGVRNIHSYKRLLGYFSPHEFDMEIITLIGYSCLYIPFVGDSQKLMCLCCFSTKDKSGLPNRSSSRKQIPGKY